MSAIVHVKWHMPPPSAPVQPLGMHGGPAPGFAFAPAFNHFLVICSCSNPTPTSKPVVGHTFHFSRSAFAFSTSDQPWLLNGSTSSDAGLAASSFSIFTLAWDFAPLGGMLDKIG